MSERHRTIAAAHLLGGSHTEAEADANAARIVACWNAMLNVEDPAAFMEEVRGVLGALMARIEVDRLWEQQRQGFGGGSVPEMYAAGLVPDEFVRARALLEKMEGK